MPSSEQAQRARQIRYYQECVIPSLPGDPKTAPPSYRYFIDMVARLKTVKPEDLTENSVLIGNSARITEILKKVEAAGFDEVILYFNVGMKPHQQVKEEMDRFMREVAPQFQGKHHGAARRLNHTSSLPSDEATSGRSRNRLRPLFFSSSLQIKNKSPCQRSLVRVVGR